MSDNENDLKVKNAGDMDEASRGLIFDGASISQLSDIFGRDRRTVTKYLREASVRPTGKRNGYPIYSLREAATYLCDMDPDFIDRRLATMNPQDLPPLITKEYWNGKSARLKFLRDDGKLWETSAVEGLLGVWVKNFIIGVRQTEDAVDRRGMLSEAQRVELQNQLQSLINMTRSTLENAFTTMKESGIGESDDDSENDQL